MEMERGTRITRAMTDSVLPRNSTFVRSGAAIGLALVFWIDTLTPPGVSESALYIVPVVLFVWGGRFWEAPLVAVVATVLAAAGLSVSPDGGSLQLARINRPLVMLAVWVAALVVAYYRLTAERWAEQNRQANSVAAESLARLEEIRYALDQAAIVAATDHRGIITYVNDKFCEISKYSREELLRQDHRIINSGYHPKEFIRDLWRTIAQGRVWRGEIRNRAKDGSIYWVDTTIVPFLDARGKPRQYLAIRSDITRRREAEAQLAAQAALTQLGQLAAVVAHEVRNPLAGLRASLEVLRSRMREMSTERDVIQTMIGRIDTLSAKVDDILRFAKPRPPVIRTVEVAPIVADAIASTRASIGQGCTIAFEPDHLAVRADPEMLRAAILNLLLNACQAGGGTVDVTIEADHDVCRLTIADRGSGIPDEVMERVFEAFYTTKKAGTGLGLPIVKRLVELQQGTITLRGREGGGTIAEMTVPLAQAGTSTSMSA